MLAKFRTRVRSLELRLFRPKACSPDGDSPEAKDDSYIAYMLPQTPTDGNVPLCLPH